MYDQLIKHINTSSSKDEFYRRIIANKDTILSQLIFKKHWELARDLHTTPAAISTIIGLLKALSKATPPYETPNTIIDQQTDRLDCQTPNTSGHILPDETPNTPDTINSFNSFNNGSQL